MTEPEHGWTPPAAPAAPEFPPTDPYAPTPAAPAGPPATQSAPPVYATAPRYPLAPYGAAEAYPPPPPPPPPLSRAPREPWFSRSELIFAGLSVLALIVVGALLGLAWHLWSGTPTRGLVYADNAIVPDETEGFVSSDGRFAALTGVAGLLAGGIAWRWRPSRGWLTAVALAVGAVTGALVTDLVGHMVAGGKETGTLDTVLPRLPLEVHAHGYLCVEGAAAVLVYLLCALFATSDDLGNAASPKPGVEQQPTLA